MPITESKQISSYPKNLSNLNITLRILLIISVVETAIMLAFLILDFNAPSVFQIALDAILLSLGSAPLLYFWVISPFVKARDLSESTLQKINHELKEAQIIAKIRHWEIEVSTQPVHCLERFQQALLSTLPSELGAPQDSVTIHPLDRPVIENALHKTVSEGKEFEVEFRTDRKDGNEQWKYCRAIQLIDKQGKLIKLTGIVQDITERKATEIALDNSESQFEEMSSLLPGAIYITRLPAFKTVYIKLRHQQNAGICRP